jgi:two-component system response regulator PilR (NtrC family)
MKQSQATSILPTDPGANRVLVVDDDLSQRLMLIRMLRKADYFCAGAMSTEEARNQLKEGPFGMVVTDLRMFAEDGIELVRHIADRYPNSYSIVVSGFVSEGDADRVRRAGAFDLLRKPIERGSFLETVERAFAHRMDTVALRRHQAH